MTLLLLVRLEGEIAEPGRGRCRRGQRAAAEGQTRELGSSMSLFQSPGATGALSLSLCTPEGRIRPDSCPRDDVRERSLTLIEIGSGHEPERPGEITEARNEMRRRSGRRFSIF